MTISRSEEGVNPHVWQSSNSHAGIPLKKRKFMLVRQPSPEPATPPSPERKAPCSPERKAPRCSPEPKAPSSPEPKAPSLPEHKAPSLPEHKAPSLPEHKAPSCSQECKAPSLPEPKAPSSPEPKAPAVPERKAPSSPERKAVSSSQECKAPSSQEPKAPSSQEPKAPSSPQLEPRDEEQCIRKAVPSISNASGLTEFSGFHGSSSTEKSLPTKVEEGSAAGDLSLGLNSVNYSHSHSSIVRTASTGLGSELSLQLAPSSNLVPEIGKEEVVRQTDHSMGVEIQTELTRNPVKTEMLFVSKVSADKASAGEQPQRVCKDQDKLDPYKWNLGLPGGHKFSNISDLKLALNRPHDANRTHWDLNTTMETWEGSLSAGASVARVGRTDAVNDLSERDIKPVIGVSQMVISKPEGSNVDSGKKIVSKSNQQYGPSDLLRLVPQSGLSVGLPSFPKQVDSSRVTSNVRVPERPVPPPKVVASRVVKSEPSDEGSRLELIAKVAPPKLVPPKLVPLQVSTAETHTPSKIPQTSVSLRAVKPEPGQDVCPKNPKGLEKLCIQSEIRPLNSVVHTPVAAVASDTGKPITEEISRASQFPSAGLSNTKEVATLLPAKKEMLMREDVVQGASKNVITAVGPLSQIACSDGKESKSAADTIGLPEKECLDVANPDDTKSDLTDGHQSKPLENREACESNEKVGISAEKDVSYENDCISDGNHGTNALGVENNDCENREVQEPLEHSAIEDGLGKVGEVLNDANRESASDVDMDISESDDNRKEEQGHNEVSFVGEPMPITPSATKTQEEEFIKYVKQLDQAERELRGNMVVTSTNTGLATSYGRDGAVALQHINRRLSSLGASSSDFSKTELHANNEEIAKDVNVGGNRSRIINLPRASSNVSHSGESGRNPIEGMVFSSRNQGEGSSDVDFKGEKFRGRGNREGRYMDPRFERKRNRDHQPYRSSGSEFRHSRGRVDNRVRNMRNEWDTEFSTDHYHGPSNFRFTRSKDNTSAKFESSDFVPRGGRTLGTGRGRGRRKSLDDELQSYRHPPSRRRSPGGRDGPVSRGVRIRRGPRDISPEGDPDLIGMRHEEKFMRVLPGEVMNKEFSRSQPQYERLEDSFLHGNQRFLPVQRRILHMPQVRSKSPPRSRTRSPGPWSSPRRRSPDEFVGHQDLNNCRSPRLYRIERMRSPQRHPCYAEEMVVRRNGSPQYISRPCNDARETRELDHRSYMRSRSPSGQIVPRNARRFVVDSRERPETDEVFAEAIHSGRFHELVAGNGGEDDRRNVIERSGPVRSFHPPYNGNSDVVNFHHHDEDGSLSRSYRFIPEVDEEIRDRGNTRGRGFERGSLRGRGFERQMKNQPDKAPPRNRSAEEQEENYWQSEQQNWHEMSPF